MEKVNAVGRRKAAIARVIVGEGNGAITINKRPLEVYFPSSILQYIVKQPLTTLVEAPRPSRGTSSCHRPRSCKNQPRGQACTSRGRLHDSRPACRRA